MQWQLFTCTENPDKSLSKKLHQHRFHLLVDPYGEENHWFKDKDFGGTEEESSGVGPLGHPGHQHPGSQNASQTRGGELLEVHPILQSAIMKFY